MRLSFKTLTGRERTVSVAPYLIDWEPVKDVSQPTARVKAFLRPFWQHDTVCQEAPVAGSRMRLDLYNVSRSIVVEVSPKGSHAYNPFFHRGSVAVYRQALKREMDKERWCTLNQLTLCELVEEDLAEGLSAELFARRFGVTL